jgi:hypothetical protein
MCEQFDEAAFSKEIQQLLTKPNKELAWYRNHKAILKRNILISVWRGKDADHHSCGDIPGVAANILLKDLYGQKGWKSFEPRQAEMVRRFAL